MAWNVTQPGCRNHAFPHHEAAGVVQVVLVHTGTHFCWICALHPHYCSLSALSRNSVFQREEFFSDLKSNSRSATSKHLQASPDCGQLGAVSSRACPSRDSAAPFSVVQRQQPWEDVKQKAPARTFQPRSGPLGTLPQSELFSSSTSSPHPAFCLSTCSLNAGRPAGVPSSYTLSAFCGAVRPESVPAATQNALNGWLKQNTFLSHKSGGWTSG